METIKYFEHGTEHERITSWQKILILMDEKGVLSKKIIHLGKHYKVNSDWERVFSFMNVIRGIHFTDQIFEMDKKFKISVNKCTCRINNGHDVNGMCLNQSCGLKIKQ